MITGFNTDIEHDGVVYHVQTEDKGLESPLILSLVYSGGAILASKRSPYEDLIADGFDEEALSQRLKRQHRLICAAINAGRIEDLKRMGSKEAVAVPSEPEPLEIITNDFAAIPQDETIEEFITNNASDYVNFTETAPPPEPAPELQLAPPVETSPYTVYDSRRQSPLGEASEPNHSLVITLLDDQDYRAGMTYQIRMLVEDQSDGTQKPLAGISLSVKILGTAFRPQLYTIKTEKDGVAVVSAQIPLFKTGRAAVLIRATAQGQTTEMRRVIQPAV